jgi:hypothetical protein
MYLWLTMHAKFAFKSIFLNQDSNYKPCVSEARQVIANTIIVFARTAYQYSNLSIMELSVRSKTQQLNINTSHWALILADPFTHTIHGYFVMLLVHSSQKDISRSVKNRGVLISP